ncbi:MAG TPA: F0F1 ATP synthase subunit A [Firmicutes bacterium]|nr:F0F1 ATP synthase subunit A [Bacillota bacterium]
MDGIKILYTFELPYLGQVVITETVRNSFIVVLLILALCLILTHKMEKIPRKMTQKAAEKLVLMTEKFVVSNMGSRWRAFTPYIMALFGSSIFGSLISLTSLRSVTADINVTLTWGVVTFIMIHFFSIRQKGVLGDLKGLLEPIPVLLPMNIISELATPVSMGFRHFGNALAGTIISTLIYQALAGLTTLLFGIGIPFLQVGVPAVLSLYFDLFSGVMQAFIFCLLTMIYISNATAEE